MPSLPLQQSHQVHLILDFDGTLTTSDTLQQLAQIGYTHNADREPPLTPWSSIVSAYLSDLSQHTSTYQPSPSSRTTTVSETSWLASLTATEQASATRALKAGIWDGITAAEVDEAARHANRDGEVRMRKGWKGLVERVLPGRRGGGCVDVVSVNWSRAWVWGCLRHAWTLHEAQGAALNIPALAVYANELPSVISSAAELPKSPRGQSMSLRTAADKLRCFAACRSDHADETVDATSKLVAPAFTIYIGDSTTDLPCLLEADLGICMRDERMGSGQRDLAEVCRRIGVEVSWLGMFEEFVDEVESEEERWKRGKTERSQRLWWANDFVEVKHWMVKYVQDGSGV